MTDHREIVIAELADENALLHERVATLEADRDTYREIVQVGIHALHNMTIERDRLKRRLAQLLDQLQGMRRAA